MSFVTIYVLQEPGTTKVLDISLSTTADTAQYEMSHGPPGELLACKVSESVAAGVRDLVTSARVRGGTMAEKMQEEAGQLLRRYAQHIQKCGDVT